MRHYSDMFPLQTPALLHSVGALHPGGSSSSQAGQKDSERSQEEEGRQVDTSIVWYGMVALSGTL